MQTLYTARYVITQNDARDLLEQGAVLTEGDRIVAVGPAAALSAAAPDAARIDLGNAAILPGLINGHTHVAMSFVRGRGDDKTLMAWLNEDIFPAEAKLTPAQQAVGCRLSLAELLRTGCTAIYDMYMRQDVLAEVADAMGIRAVLGESLTRFYPSMGGSSLEDILAKTRARMERTRDRPLLRHAIAPHAVYTTDPEVLTRCRAFADETGVLFYMHMCETKDEEAQCLRETGKKPLPYCRDLGILRADTSLAHCVHLDDEDIAILRETGAIPVHNPASNMKLASGAAPLRALRDAGIPIALGTDGPASNNQQNLFREMWLAALLAKFSSGEPASMTAQQTLDLATRNGAAALHNPDIGSLEPGKQADFCALDLTALFFQPVSRDTLLSHIVYAASGLENRLTVVAGEVLYRDGAFTRFDERELLREARVTLGTNVP